MVYRTRDLGRWSANAPRLAKRLVQQGQLVQLAHGLFAHPKRSRFGVVPPSDNDLLRAFLADGPFVITGPEQWNALGLGTTAAFARPLVYNTKRSGVFKLGGRQLLLRRVAFPTPATLEWFVIDLFENAEQVSTAPDDLVPALTRALNDKRFSREALSQMARRYGSRRTQQLIGKALNEGSQ
jgi:hypothetical protein